MGIEQADPKNICAGIALDADKQLIVGPRRAALVLLDVAAHAWAVDEHERNAGDTLQTPHQASASLAASSGVKSA
jgi:hypothetical protein